jgi:hypothetical protein
MNNMERATQQTHVYKTKFVRTSPMDFTPENFRRRRHWFADLIFSIW